MENDFYTMIRDFTSYYLNDGYYNPELKLLWCPSYEHARAPYYLSDYDLMTNVFAAEALGLMVLIAQRHGDEELASIWGTYRTNILEGISKNLKTKREDKDIYAELRLKDSPDDLLFGLSFVNLSPIPAEGGISNITLMDNTIDIYEKQGSFMWGDHRVLFTNVSPDRQDEGIYSTNWQVIGKGLAWEMLYNALRGKWNRLNILQDWLQTYNSSTLFGEAFNYVPFANGQQNYIQDAGNLEQTLWYVWTQTKIRKMLIEFFPDIVIMHPKLRSQ